MNTRFINRLIKLETHHYSEDTLDKITDEELDRRIIELVCSIQKQPLGGVYHQKLLALNSTQFGEWCRRMYKKLDNSM